MGEMLLLGAVYLICLIVESVRNCHSASFYKEYNAFRDNIVEPFYNECSKKYIAAMKESRKKEEEYVLMMEDDLDYIFGKIDWRELYFHDEKRGATTIDGKLGERKYDPISKRNHFVNSVQDMVLFLLVARDGYEIQWFCGQNFHIRQLYNLGQQDCEDIFVRFAKVYENYLIAAHPVLEHELEMFLIGKAYGWGEIAHRFFYENITHQKMESWNRIKPKEEPREEPKEK